MKCTTFSHIFFFVLLSSVIVFAQNDDNKKTDKQQTKIEESGENGNPNSPQATGDEINFLDDESNPLMIITDEGSSGSITIPPLIGAPTTTTNKLYNVDNTLFFNGSSLGGGGGGATSINDLTDAISDGASLFLGLGSGVNDDGTSNQNTAVGINSLNLNTLGGFNSAFGLGALYSNVAGSNGVAIGYYSQYYANNTTTAFENRNTFDRTFL